MKGRFKFSTFSRHNNTGSCTFGGIQRDLCIRGSVRIPPDMSSGEYTRLIDANINIFGLTQYDGLTQFFAEGTYALPQVEHL